ncbi:MAG TPA: GNAT family N-acetyltransferase [Ktedonosporobacter sp.]|nr:GNAT family N-acetyltransferase [Ktedonosporobacter sp.]
MSKIVTNLSDPLLAEAIEVNLAAEMSIFGRGLPGAALHAEPELLWFETGRPTLNGVLLTRLASNDNASVDAKITAMIDHFRSQQLSFSWSIGPATRPANLVTLLEQRGFTHVHTSPAMAVDIQTIPTETQRLAGLTIQEVTNRAMMKIKIAIEKEGFDSSEEDAQNYYIGYMASGFGKGSNWHHYIGSLHETPVAIASLLLQAGVAGIYGVTTVPAARRQGIAASMTQHVLREAHAAGYRIAILTATDMSQNIYRRLGFQDYCTVNHYRWYPMVVEVDNSDPKS